jgi:KDEL-tailed cysteine endopeptidase
MTNLSIQELLDCDTAEDQGCTGGNPLLAFFFIHRYGLTTWQDYPYVEIEETCNMDLVSRPIATVESWGVLPKNHEDVIEMVLRYIGPVAVGVNGGHPSCIA